MNTSVTAQKVGRFRSDIRNLVTAMEKAEDQLAEIMAATDADDLNAYFKIKDESAFIEDPENPGTYIEDPLNHAPLVDNPELANTLSEYAEAAASITAIMGFVRTNSHDEKLYKVAS